MSKTLAAGAMISLALAAFGCKGETKVRDNPKTTKQLKVCEEKKDEKDKRIKQLEARVSELELGGTATGDEVLVKIDGDLMTVRGNGPNARAGGGTPRGNAADDELYKAFLKELNGSRGRIKKCYQMALKKNSAITARTISLTVRVKFNTAGKAISSSAAPDIDNGFSVCMRQVAQSWQVPGPPQVVTFEAPITLSPQ